MVAHFRHLTMPFLIHCHQFRHIHQSHFETIIDQSKTFDDKKSVPKLANIFPDFIIHGHYRA